MIMNYLAVAFSAFPTRKDALLSNTKSDKIIVAASGSLGLYKGSGKSDPTYPNQTLQVDEKIDWCSNIASSEDFPWIEYSFAHKAVKLTGYSIRNGCCYYDCCCDPDTGKIIDYYCCCALYSFSLEGSNDNKTWKTIHKVEKDSRFYRCETKTYTLSEKSESFLFIRFRLDESIPGCPRCLQINQIELYGEQINSFAYDSFENDEDNEESISIIGKVKHD